MDNKQIIEQAPIKHQLTLLVAKTVAGAIAGFIAGKLVEKAYCSQITPSVIES